MRNDYFNRLNSSLPRWIRIWLQVSTVICALDVAFTMLRPHTLRGNIYSDVDLRYSSTNDIVTMATGRLMIVEIILNIVALYLCRRHYPQHAKLTAFLTSAFVFWKTLLYMTMFIVPPQGSVNYLAKSAGIWKRLFIFWLPNLVWCFFPLAVIAHLWRDLANPSPY